MNIFKEVNKANKATKLNKAEILCRIEEIKE